MPSPAWLLLVVASLVRQVMPSPQTPPAPQPSPPQPAAVAPPTMIATQPVQQAAIPAGQPLTVSVPATSLVLQQTAPTVYVVPPATPANIVVLQPAPAPATISVVQPASYVVMAQQPAATVAAVPAGQPVLLTTVKQPGPIKTAAANLGTWLAGLKCPRLQKQQAVAVVPIVTTPASPAAPPMPPPPSPNSAGLLEPSSKRGPR